MLVDKILSKLILKDTSGSPSWSLSLAVMSFFVTVFLMLFGGQEIDIVIGTFFKFKTKIAPIDAGVIAIFFPTSMGLYFARRYTTSKMDTVFSDGVSIRSETSEMIMRQPGSVKSKGPEYTVDLDKS